MEQMIYVKDLTNRQIGDAIGRLCVMADIEPPEMGKDIVEFLRDKFWKWDAQLFKMAFDTWMGGNYPEIMRVKKINLVFLSMILNTYVQNNFHKLPKYTPPAIAPPKPSEAELDELHKKSFDLVQKQWMAVYRDHRMEMISLKLMEIHWERLMEKRTCVDDFEPRAIRDMIEWLVDYDDRYTKKLSKQMNNPNKARRFNEVMAAVTHVNHNHEMMMAAAKFALFLNKKHGIK
jgi:hypothetical protein